LVADELVWAGFGEILEVAEFGLDGFWVCAVGSWKGVSVVYIEM
jgi:hypothetical protein